jgi:membrane fusion protein (multidrug efflux system)
MRNKKLWIVAGVFSAITLIAWYARVSITRQAQMLAEMQRITAATVEAEPVAVGPMVQQISTIGVLRANQMVVIKPDAPGHIADIRFKEGDFVQAGAPLIILDNAVQEAEHNSTTAVYMTQKANFDRAQELLKRGVGFAQQLDKARAEYKQAEAQMQLAKARLDKTILKAPFSGFVSLGDINIGAYVTQGQELVTLVDPHPMKVEFQVPELYINEVRPRQQLEITVESHSHTPIEATIDAIDAKIDPLSHSVIVRAILNKNIANLKPGQFANVRLEVGTIPDAIQIPESALETNGDQNFVYRAVEGKALKTRVIAGIHEGTRVQIVDGLKESDVVVTAGQVKLRDGEPIRIVNGKDQDKSSDSGLKFPLSGTASMANAIKAISLATTGKADGLTPSAPKNSQGTDATDAKELKQPDESSATSAATEPAKSEDSQPSAAAETEKNTSEQTSEKSEQHPEKAEEQVPESASTNTAQGTSPQSAQSTKNVEQTTSQGS